MLAPGDTFAGYTVVRELGSGGMGAVYLVRHPRLPRTDALKVLRRELSADPDYSRRFLREAELVAGLSHRNVVPVLDRGEDAGRLWLTMAFVDGSDGEAALHAAGGRFTPQRAVHVVGEVAAALDAAHRQGLVHRDVKPANVLLRPGHDDEPEQVFLTDFGIAKPLEAGSTRLTRTGMVIATFDYASPEQVESRPLSSRSDVYSLGCVLHRLLTGSVPFPGETLFAALHGHVALPPPRPSQHVPGLPPALDEVVARAMAKDPDERYPTCRALAAAARAALQGPGRAAAPPTVVDRPDPATVPPPPGAPPPWDGGGPTRQQTRPGGHDDPGPAPGPATRVPAAPAAAGPGSPAPGSSTPGDRFAASSGPVPPPPWVTAPTAATPPPRRRRGAVLVAALAALAVAVAAAVFVLTRPDDGAGADGTTTAGGSAGAAMTASATTAAPTSTAAQVAAEALPRSAEPLPDGSVVVVRADDQGQDLFTVDSASGTATRITAGADDEHSPVLSPDRRTVAYLDTAADGSTELLAMPTGGGAAAPLVRLPGDCATPLRPAWDPADPTRIALPCRAADGTRSLQVVALDGTVVTVLDVGPYVGDVAFSPDGQQLVYWSATAPGTDGGALTAVAADGSTGPRPVTTSADRVDADPVWSAAGIAFRRAFPDGTRSICLVQPDGSGFVVLTTGGYDEDPSWAPDGERIVYKSRAGAPQGLTRMWTMDADGSGAEQLGPVPDGVDEQSEPAWGPR